MLRFVRGFFKALVTLILWIALLGCVIGGVILGGKPEFDSDSIVVMIIGGLLGLLIGLIIITAVGGFIATIMNIDENLERIANHYSKGGKQDYLDDAGRIANRLLEKDENERHPWDYKRR